MLRKGPLRTGLPVRSRLQVCATNIHAADVSADTVDGATHPDAATDQPTGDVVDCDPPCPAGFVCMAGSTCQTGDEVFVPGGSFWMGCNESKREDCGPNELPAHEVTLSAFAVDKTEVTRIRFADFLSEVAPDGDCERRISGASGVRYDNAAGRWKSALPGDKTEPMIQVTWFGARDFCDWDGKRLCTEAEWEKAARGGCERLTGDCRSQMLVFPWGDAAPSCSLAVTTDETGAGCGRASPFPVGTRPDGASPYGALDMAGNVREWVADWLAPYEPDSVTDPEGPATGDEKVLRGGSYSPDDATMLQAAARDSKFLDPTAPPKMGDSRTGFRCCRAITP